MRLFIKSSHDLHCLHCLAISDVFPCLWRPLGLSASFGIQRFTILTICNFKAFVDLVTGHSLGRMQLCRA